MAETHQRSLINTQSDPMATKQQDPSEIFQAIRDLRHCLRDSKSFDETEAISASFIGNLANPAMVTSPVPLRPPDPPDLDQSDPISAIKTAPEEIKASSLSSKVSRKYSCEEIHERMANGFCLFCEELDTPGHYQLKHKRSKIFMTECEDDQVLGAKDLVSVDLNSITPLPPTKPPNPPDLNPSELVSTIKDSIPLENDAVNLGFEIEDEPVIYEKHLLRADGGLDTQILHKFSTEVAADIDDDVVVSLENNSELSDCNEWFPSSYSLLQVFVSLDQEDELSGFTELNGLHGFVLAKHVWEPGGILIEHDEDDLDGLQVYVVRNRKLEAELETYLCKSDSTLAEGFKVASTMRHNIRSYGVWHHRKRVLEKGNQPELRFLDKFKRLYFRNCHDWSCYRFVTEPNDRPEHDKLKDTEGYESVHQTTCTSLTNKEIHEVTLLICLQKNSEIFFPLVQETRALLVVFELKKVMPYLPKTHYAYFLKHKWRSKSLKIVSDFRTINSTTFSYLVLETASTGNTRTDLHQEIVDVVLKLCLCLGTHKTKFIADIEFYRSVKRGPRKQNWWIKEFPWFQKLQVVLLALWGWRGTFMLSCLEEFGASSEMDLCTVFCWNFVNHTRSGTGTNLWIRPQNFMCHSNLEIESSEWVNFFTGPNEGDKRKILMDLCVLFGFQATGIQHMISDSTSSMGPKAHQGKRISKERVLSNEALEKANQYDLGDIEVQLGELEAELTQANVNTDKWYFLKNNAWMLIPVGVGLHESEWCSWSFNERSWTICDAERKWLLDKADGLNKAFGLWELSHLQSIWYGIISHKLFLMRESSSNKYEQLTDVTSGIKSALILYQVANVFPELCVYRVFHLLRPPESHRAKRYDETFYHDFSLSSLRTRMFSTREYCDRNVTCYLVYLFHSLGFGLSTRFTNHLAWFGIVIGL